MMNSENLISSPPGLIPNLKFQSFDSNSFAVIEVICPFTFAYTVVSVNVISTSHSPKSRSVLNENTVCRVLCWNIK